MLSGLRPARRPAAGAPARHQRGLSIVELMVGIAIGLIVVAGATLLMSNQLNDNRRLLLETQVQQDLRAASDLIARDLRRAGYWGSPQQGLAAGGGAANPYAAIAASGAAGASEVTYAYSKGSENGTLDDSDRAGFRLRNGVIEMLMGGGGWQALTDGATLQVTSLQIGIDTQQVALSCVSACPASAANCPPQQTVRSAVVAISGRAAHDSAVQRSVRQTVRLRNDQVSGSCPA